MALGDSVSRGEDDSGPPGEEETGDEGDDCEVDWDVLWKKEKKRRAELAKVKP